MRFIIPVLVCCTMGFETSGQAAPQRKSAPVRPSALQPPLRDLPIPVLPNAPVQLEFDGTEQDLLGMLKSFARGLETANAQGGNSPAANIFVALMADKQFSAVLKDIRHLHLVVYDLSKWEDAAQTTSAADLLKSLTPPGATMEMMPSPGSPPKSSVLPKVPDAVPFYEKPFRAAGGKRLLMSNSQSTKVLMFGFTQPQGFALIVSTPSRVIVARADGYPNMEALGRMIRSASPTQSTPAQLANPNKPKPTTPRKSPPVRR